MEGQTAIAGRFVWLCDAQNSAYKRESYYAEPQDKIVKCLTCTKEHCDNCLSKRGRPRKDVEKEMVALLRNGEPMQSIMQLLNIGRASFFRIKKNIKENYAL